MKKKKTLAVFTVFLVLILAFLAVVVMPMHAQSASDSGVMGKLDEILNNQKIILNDLSGIKEELRIIKIRVTQQQ